MRSVGRVSHFCHHVGRVSRGCHRRYRWSSRVSGSVCQWRFGRKSSLAGTCRREFSGRVAWINLPFICVRAEIWAWRGSRFALIFSSMVSGEKPVLVSSFRSVAFISTATVVSSASADISGRTCKL